MNELLFNRKCVVVIGLRGAIGKQFEGLRVSFKITKNLENNPNAATIEITNLSKESRALTEKKESFISLEVGYGESIKQIYSGDIAYSTTKKTGTDFITTIEAGDGEFEYTTKKIDTSYGENSKFGTILDSVIDSFGLKKGSIKGINESEVFKNGFAASGMVKDVLNNLTAKQNVSWSIQNGKLQILPNNTANDNTAILLSSATGLIGVPQKTFQNDPNQQLKSNENKKFVGVSLVSLLQPEIFPGRYIKIDSDEISGEYICQKVTHNGDTHGTSWYSEIEAI